ncbi:MAG: hypothetical protein ACOCSE_04580 [Chitinivibrionales bacterium]
MKKNFLFLFFCLLLFHTGGHTAAFNAFSQDWYSTESSHFRLHYTEGLGTEARKIGSILEELHSIYRDKYKIDLPDKTEVLVVNTETGSGWALALQNTISIDVNSFDFNLRGTSNWLRNVVAHEYAHIVSIAASFKLPSSIPYIQGGFFTHPNNIIQNTKGRSFADNFNQAGARLEAMHLFPSEILPPWFFEGIAQYESTCMEGDRWDSHRDMILRALTLSDSLLSWDHISVFTGKSDDYEKTYNHGFSLVKYISEKYGHESINAILRASKGFFRGNFNRSIKEVLGITGEELYENWNTELKKKYKEQVEGIGKQVYGKKISEMGFDNQWPKFGPDDNKIYYLSNGKHDYAFHFRMLYSYNLTDSSSDSRTELESGKVKSVYDINDSTGLLVYTSSRSKESRVPVSEGGINVNDIFIDTLRDSLGDKNTDYDHQATEKQRLMYPSFSPDGDMIVCGQHDAAIYHLVLLDSSGRMLDTIDPGFSFNRIFSTDWSIDGRNIAVSYMDGDNRKIGIYDTLTKDFSILCGTEHDERDPVFSEDGTSILFSSDRTGIFNIYEYSFASEKLRRITNVSGGAFCPDLSSNGRSLTFSAYTPSGYGIFLIDTIEPVESEDLSITKALTHTEGAEDTIDYSGTSYFNEDKYNPMPRKFLCIPTIIGEQLITDNDNPYQGITHLKYGGLFYLNDPLSWLDKGTNIGALFLSETLNPFRLFDDFNINHKISYDFGIFGFTDLLPLDLSFIYQQRAIAGKQEFMHNYNGPDTVEVLNYSLNPRMTELKLTHEMSRSLSLNLFITYLNYKVYTELDDGQYFNYSPNKGFRTGSFLSFSHKNVQSNWDISPTGFLAKIKYEFWNQYMQKEYNSFVYENGMIKENYDNIKFNQITFEMQYGKDLPWFNHDIYTEFDATGLRITSDTKDELEQSASLGEQSSADLPAFFKPATMIPGYLYYYPDTNRVESRDSSGRITEERELVQDTVLISGNGYIKGNLSYRFPLYPGVIDKKLGFLYLERLYGAFNFGGAAAVEKISDINNLSKEDILKWWGVELRLQTISFNTYPMAIIARYDYGIDHDKPIGGSKFLLQIGFSFDDWDVVVEPDGIDTRSLR